ncbi:MAG TPA: ROK family protein [Dehalococcoidia bacterium]|nr:ROK family protein [Dehalococcoidia bacterium]
MSTPGFIGGIDLGGTKILSLCIDEELATVGQDLRATEAGRGPNAVIETMAASFLAAAGGRTLRAVGVSAPGPSNPAVGLVTSPPNLPGWRDVPLAALLSARLGLPCWIENDANAAALAEHRLGAGRGSRHMILVTLGTGIGGGLILDGRLYHGASGAAGEIGHMQLVPGGPSCGCGRSGCLEALASGIALAREATALAVAEPVGLVASLARQENVEPDARILDQAADAGDLAADAIIRQAGRYLGAGLTNLVDVFNPEVIVIGGSLRKLGQRYLGTAYEVVEREAFRQSKSDVRFVEATLGDEAPAVGAALVALDRLTSSDQA